MKCNKRKKCQNYKENDYSCDYSQDYDERCFKEEGEEKCQN